MRWLRFTIPFWGCLATVACSSEPNVDFFQNLTLDADYPGTAGDPTAYENLLSYTPDPDCNPDVPVTLDGHTEVRIFRGNGIGMDDVVRFVGGLKRYYDHYGEILYTRHDVIALPLDHAIVLNQGAITNHMSQSGVDPSCASSYYPGTECEQAMGEAMFYNVKQFLHLYAEPWQNLINIVLLKRVVSLDPGSDALEAWGVAGLGLSQSLVNSANGSDLGGSLADTLNETNFAPTIFVGVNLVSFVLPEPDTVIAHEFGHAYGLAHVDDTTNLMNPVAVNCSQSLDLSQLSTIEQQTAKGGNLTHAALYSPTEFLSFTHRAAEIMEIMRARIGQQASTDGAAP